MQKLVRDVWDAYGHLTGYDLVRIAQAERPWVKARGGLRPTDEGRHEIPVAEILADFKTKPVEEDEPAHA